MEPAFLTLIQSARVAEPTRRALMTRLQFEAQARVETGLSNEELLLLQAITERLIPQHAGSDRIEIACVLASRRRHSVGDGWRFANMPPDQVALELGLRLIDQTAHLQSGSSFTSLNTAQQDTLLGQVQRGEVDWPELDAGHWFEEMLAESTEIYVSHPETLAAMGFSGIAFLPRWNQVGLRSTQAWEPAAQ